MKRGSIKRPRNPRNTCRHTTGDNREISCSLKQYLPAREPVHVAVDVSVITVVMAHEQQAVTTFDDGSGGGWGWKRFGGLGYRDATAATETYKVGTLIVDLFDTKTKQLIWRGSSSDTLSNNSDKNIKNLDKGAEKMFKHFPPGSSKK